jgi:general secretion pathway protein H
MAAPGAKNMRRHSTGFSLIEILVVLVIIGIIVSLVGVSVSSGSRPYEIDGALNEFMDVAEYALDEAQFSGIDLGLLVESNAVGGVLAYRYQWLERYDNTRWRPSRFAVDAFGMKLLPEGVEVVLEVEQGVIPLQEELDAEEQQEEETRPQAIFYSSGETTPGIMTWIDSPTGDVLWELEWDLVGRLTKRRAGLAEDDE